MDLEDRRDAFLHGRSSIGDEIIVTFWTFGDLAVIGPGLERASLLIPTGEDDEETRCLRPSCRLDND